VRPLNESEAAKTTEAAEEEEEEEEEEDEGLPGGMPSGCVLVIEGIQNREIGKGAIKAALEEDFDVALSNIAFIGGDYDGQSFQAGMTTVKVLLTKQA